ncbi:MAG TPA: hypothetical protein VMW09_06840 [Desulfatiglandales bacterium]|nr:hypothetical protein [Desulfatiglandales bacterium]
MGEIKKITKAIEAKQQGKTPTAKESDVDKKIQTLIADIDQLKFAKNQDFKVEATELIKQLINWCLELQQQRDEDLEEITTTLKNRFKIMDKAITNLVKFRQGVEDLRFVLLFNIARYDYAFDKLVEMGLIGRWTKEIYQNIWDDNLINILGFDCNAEELKKKMTDMLKNEQKKEPHDQMAAVPQ